MKTDSRRSEQLKRGFLSLLFIVLLMILLLPSAFAVPEYDCAADRHKYNVAVIDPTADTDGEKVFACELCGYQYTQILYAADHRWGEWIIDRHPTCTEAGEKHRTCTATAIPHRETQPILALGHDYSVTEKEPACTEQGKKIYKCKRCSETYTEITGQALGHSYKDEITTLPTYDKEGVRTFTCEHCKDTYAETVARVTDHEHQYKVHSEVKPDCEQNGHITYSCTVCGDTRTETVSAVGHNYGEWVQDKEPTLFGSGHRHSVCEHNAAHVINEDISQLVTLEVNTTDAVMAPVNAGFIFFFLLTLLSDVYVILWDLRKRRKTKKAGRLKRRYALCAAALVGFIIGFPMLLKLIFTNVSYMNLMAFTAIAVIIPAGIILRVYSNQKRTALNGNGGVFEPGEQKGLLVSRNHS